MAGAQQESTMAQAIFLLSIANSELNTDLVILAAVTIRLDHEAK